MNIFEITLYNEKKDFYNLVYAVTKELSQALQYLDSQGISKNQTITAINKLNQTTKVHLI